MTVRVATEADRSQLARLLRQLHPEALDPGSLPRVRQEARTFVAGEPVVGLAVVTFVDYGLSAYGVLEELVVDEAARGAGVGRALVAECERWLLELDAEVVFVSAVDAGAARFYRRSGFSDCTGPWLFRGLRVG
ncbi:GNAT family N-acetyltransferase [Kribbella sandramycini]|uniref:GNAT family N-acetyltransferase n=1 Tax=Kribbella sandramycini TaxID=60450 RepID=A0A7Y4KVP0_9ACTN|nr:GNAT family N-acetyltransferase [Kribbella sandramycini]MBB6567992.1 N-acetylglutamate synthase-like GNAT family acetyltransferase [Kribbella sandramycini]NOL39414.1 GNAT family N-acetyltransferase [Kribbella sandramycini]